MNTKAVIPWCYTRFRLQRTPQSIAKYLHYFPHALQSWVPNKRNKNKVFQKGPRYWIWILEEVIRMTSDGWSFLRGQSLQMIICKRTEPLNDHLQEAESSGWSFAIGPSLHMIICIWPDPPDDHLRDRILWMIICNWPDPPDDYFQEAGSSEWSFARGQIPRMIFCKRPDPPDDHLPQWQQRQQ